MSQGNFLFTCAGAGKAGMMISIESGIPIPKRGHNEKYPFDGMNPGDSFFVPTTAKRLRSVQLSLASSMKNQAKRTGAKFTQRRSAEPVGIRVWRVS